MKLLYIDNGVNEPLLTEFKRYFETEIYSPTQNIKSYKPNFIYLHSGAIKPHHLQEITTECKIMQWAGDYRPGGLQEVKDAKPYCQYTMTSDKNQYEFETHFVPHGVPDKFFREPNKNGKGIIFIGNDYSHLPGAAERTELAKTLKETKQFTWYGSGAAKHIPYHDIPDAYNSHAYAIGANIFYDGPHWFGNRPLMAMAGGTCCLIRHFPGCEQYFTHNHNCLIYHNNQEAIDLINNTDEQTRFKIAQNGHQLVKEKYTYSEIVNMMLAIIRGN